MKICYMLAYCVHTSVPTVPLSAKQIIECSTSYGNHGCEGGSAVNAFKYVNASEGLNPAIYYLLDLTVRITSNTIVAFLI